jgi:hypothetical protein
MAFRSLCLSRNRISNRVVSNPSVLAELGSTASCYSMPAVNRMVWAASHHLLRRCMNTSTTFTASSSARITPLNQAVRCYDFSALSMAKNTLHVSPPCSLVAGDFVQPHQQQQRRYKHSSTQIKRLFRRNPARLRVEKRIWNIDRKQPLVILDDNFSPLQESRDGPVESAPPTNAASVEDEAVSLPPQSLLFPRVYTPPAKLPNGWFEPMDPALRPTYPFSVARTKNKPKDSIGFLPIYTKYRYVAASAHFRSMYFSVLSTHSKCCT